MSSPELDHRDSRRSSSLNRNSGRSYKMHYDDYNGRSYNSRDRSDKAQVIASGFPAEVLDHEIKDALHLEIEKFGYIGNIQLRGRDQNRLAYITFRDDDSARKLRSFCLERHCKVTAFQRTLHFDFELSDMRDYNNSRDRGYNNHRGSFNHRINYQKGEYRNDRYNDRSDYDNRDRGFTQNRDRYNNENHINPRATRTLFVGNLEHSMTKEELMRIFEHWGAIDDIDVKRPQNGIPAYAFIKYLELEAAASAKNQMYGKEINGRPIKVGYGKTLPSTRLWIGGLGQWCSPEMLNREFDRFGALRKIDYEKGSRHAFIEFESLDASSAAHAEMRGFPLGGPDRKIKIDYAEVDRNRSNNDREKNFDNRSDDGHYNDYSRGNNRFESRYENQGNYNRGRGRGNFDNQTYARRNDYARENNRTERRRTRSRSPVNSEREYRQHTPSDKGGSPQSKNRSDNSPGSRTHNNSSTSKEYDKNGSSSPNTDNVENVSKPTESLVDVSKRFVVAWRGAFALKNSAFPVRMHLIGGNPELANFFLRGIGVGAGPAIKVLSVTQRLRLDPPKLEEVSRRIQQVGAGGHCILLALPTGDDIELESSFQKRPLKSLVTYFTKKEAAGVIILNTESPSGKQEESGMLHAFPPCEFSQYQLLKVAPNIGSQPSKEDHLMVIVVKGTSA